MSYKKWKLQRLEAVDVVVITDSKLSRKELYGAINYTQVYFGIIMQLNLIY